MCNSGPGPADYGPNMAKKRYLNSQVTRTYTVQLLWSINLAQNINTFKIKDLGESIPVKSETLDQFITSKHISFD